jgi:triosephosphate isomerase
MKKQKKLIVGNWKMNPQSLVDAKKIALGVKRIMKSVKRSQVVLCPPFVYISPLSGVPKGQLFLGAENVHHEMSGSFTGEVSYSQLPQFNVTHVIVGHSERRKMGETSELINKKALSVINYGMTAIVCIGESVRDPNGDYYNFIKGQIADALKDVPKKLLDRVVVAYEPIWAIGAKEAMSPRDLHEMSIFIRKVLKDLFGIASDSVRILYGGSADRVNCDALVREGEVSGLLVGRQSLVPADFVEMIKLIDAI